MSLKTIVIVYGLVLCLLFQACTARIAIYVRDNRGMQVSPPLK